MIRAGLVGVAALAAAPALAAEGGAIRGGEHVGFSRIVMTIEPTTEWSLERSDGRATLFFPGKALDFSTGGTFEMLPRTRIGDVRAAKGASGTTVEVEIGCACRISTSFVGARYLALDVADRAGTPPVAEATARPVAGHPVAQEAHETAVITSAEQILIRQIERAASQGLIELSAGRPGAEPAPAAPAPVTAAEPASPEPAPPEPAHAQVALTAAEAPEPPGTPETSAPPALPLRAEPPAEHGKDMPARPLDREQIRATTVFDRYGHGPRAAAKAETPSECLPDAALDVSAWSNGLPLHVQAAALGRGLVGEFDTPDPVTLRDLARLHVRFGFGAEAVGLLGSFDVALEDRALLDGLARAVEGREAAADGPLGLTAACSGRHGLWLALGGAAPVFRDPAHFATVQAAFAELPPEMRALLGPRLIGRLLDAGRPEEARLVYDTSVRPGFSASAELSLAEARLVAVEGHPDAAVHALSALVEANAHNSVEALTHLVRLAVDAGLPISERLITDLRAAAVQYRRSKLEAPLRSLLAEALAGQAALGPAIGEIRAARSDLPADAAAFDALAVRLLAAADPAVVGRAAYAGILIDAADLIGTGATEDPARRALAARLIELGLPNAALDLLAPLTARGDPAARLLAARAQLRLGRVEAARLALGDLEGPEAAEVRARSFALGGDFGQAAGTLLADDRTAEAAPYAWPAGDWPRARDAAPTPERVAMAAYMAARADGAAPQAPSPDPATLTPETAFQEPLPSLARPSLDAARRLLATGRQVQGFVQGLLVED